MKKEVTFWSILVILTLFRVLTFSENSFKEGSHLRLTGVVKTEPVIYDKTQGFFLYGLKVYLPKYPRIYYGDKVVVEGIVEDQKLKDAKLIKVEETKNILFTFRKKLLAFYKGNLPKKHFALVSGVVLGSKEGIDTDFYNILKNSGTIHVVVASGMNVSFVGGFLLAIFLSFLSRKHAILISLVGIWVYSIIAGFEAPIVRAAIMGSMAFLAVETGRISNSLRALFLTFFVMLIFNPSWMKDLGFILSFVATLSLMLFEPFFNRLLHFVPTVFREGFATSLAAQVGVSPIIYFVFGQFNILSPLINGLVLWTIAPITIIGMASGIVGLIIPKLGTLILYLAYPLSSIFIKVVEVF